MNTEIKIMGDKDSEKWDDIVVSSCQGTIFHTWKWIKIMEKHSLQKILINNRNVLYPIMVMKGSEPIGIMPLYFSQNPIMNIVTSPPSGVENFYLGPVIKNYSALKSREKQEHLLLLHREIDKFIKKILKANFIKISSGPGLEDSRPFRWSGYEVEPRYTYILNLKDGKDKIWKNFSKGLRYDIEKAKKESIEVREGSKEDLESIYELLRKRDRIHATKEFMTEIFDNFSPENLKVFIAEKENEFLSGIITTCFKNKVNFWIGAPKFSYKGISPNELILWESIQSAMDKGYEFYEIMGADELALYPFKSKFNAELIFRLNIRCFSPKFRLMNTIYRAIKTREY